MCLWWICSTCIHLFMLFSKRQFSYRSVSLVLNQDSASLLMIFFFLVACCRLVVRMLIVSFYPRATEKTSPIYRNLSKKDLKYTSCLITMMYIASPLIRDIGLAARLAAASARKRFSQLSFSVLLVKWNVDCTANLSNAAGKHPNSQGVQLVALCASSSEN